MDRRTGQSERQPPSDTGDRTRQSATAGTATTLAWFGGKINAQPLTQLAAELGNPRALGREAMAGIVASLVTLAQCLSFSALIFSANLSSGFAAGVWAFMLGSALASLLLALTTTLPPALAGPRNPAIPVMSVLAATIAADVLATGASSDAAVRTVLLGLSLATLLTGLLLWLLGAFRLGQIVRFIPYPVIAGFLGASGFLLITGGIRVAVGHGPTFSGAMLAISSGEMAKLAVAFGFAAILTLLRRLGGASTLPLAVVGTIVVLDLVLWVSGGEGWYLTAHSKPAAWSPFGLIAAGGTDWSIIARTSAEIFAVAAVTLISLLLDVSGLEVQRSLSADMDREFRSNGRVNLIMVPFGGFSTGLAPNTSRLIEALGGRGRVAGLFGGLFIAAILIFRMDLASLVPMPVLAGMLVYLGVGVMRDVLARAPTGGSRVELALAVAIMVAIVQFGYLTGVVLGVVGACILFAVQYSRIGVIRRHVTRAVFASNVQHSPDVMQHLAAEGGRIHIFWLTGYIFFGSSNRLFEDIRRLAGQGTPGRKRWIVLDLAAVPGLDSSAAVSFVKLRNWAEQNDVALAWAGLTPAVEAEFRGASLIDGTRGAFPSRGDAMVWCEEQLSTELHRAPGSVGLDAFQTWLARELGPAESQRLIEGYFDRRELAAGDLVCAQGDPSETIELIATGSVAVVIEDAAGRRVQVRRMAGHTVVGEMGFFRGLARAASVVADERATVYVMSRRSYERLVAMEPALGAAFLAFIVRALSDRVEFANAEIAALL